MCKLIAKKCINKRVLITTTTKIFVPEEQDMSLYIGDIEGIEDIVNKNCVITAGQKIITDNKFLGYKTSEIDKLASRNLFDVIIVEADGAKRKSIKAAGINDPVIPLRTDEIIGFDRKSVV